VICKCGPSPSETSTVTGPRLSRILDTVERYQHCCPHDNHRRVFPVDIFVSTSTGVQIVSQSTAHQQFSVQTVTFDSPLISKVSCSVQTVLQSTAHQQAQLCKPYHIRRSTNNIVYKPFTVDSPLISKVSCSVKTLPEQHKNIYLHVYRGTSS